MKNKSKGSTVDSEDTRRGRTIWIGAAIAFFAVIATWFVSCWVLEARYEELTDRGVFGDSFGAINALFSGLAFAGVIVAILLQGEELRLQRKELEDTRAELSRQADAAEASKETLEKQRHATLASAGITAEASLFQGAVARWAGSPAANRSGPEEQMMIRMALLEERLKQIDPESPNLHGSVRGNVDDLGRQHGG